MKKENLEKTEKQVDEKVVGEKPKRKKISLKLLFKLFYSSLYISAIAFGGGFVMLSLMRDAYVKRYKWISDDDLLDVNAIAQASPGAIATNSSLLLGYKMAGPLGALFTLVGSVIPPILVITGVYYFYDAISSYQFITYMMKGMQAGVSAVIISLVIDMWSNIIKKKSPFAISLMVFSFIASTASLFFFNISVVIYVVILSAILGIGFAYLSYFKEQKKKAGKKI